MQSALSKVSSYAWRAWRSWQLKLASFGFGLKSAQFVRNVNISIQTQVLSVKT